MNLPDSVVDALLDMLEEARASDDIGGAVLRKYEAALEELEVPFEPE